MDGGDIPGGPLAMGSLLWLHWDHWLLWEEALKRGACDDESEELLRALRHHGLCTVARGLGGCWTGVCCVLCQGSAMAEQQ